MKPHILCAAMITIALAALCAQGSQAQTAGSTIGHLNAQAPGEYAVVNPRYEINWPRIPEAEIAWGRRLWRIIDMQAAGNEALRAAAASSGTLAMLFVNAAANSQVFAGSDARLNHRLQPERLTEYLKASPGFNASQCSRYLIKEDWLFSAAENRLVARIQAIAPLRETTAADGTIEEQPAFWVYYPSIRETLRAHPVEQGAKNLDQLFELRQFQSIVDSAGAIRTSTALR